MLRGLTGRELLVVAWLAVQIALPLRWYLGDDPFDERFAWRMFSEIRTTRCAVDLLVDGEQVALGKRYHQAWITLAKRVRRPVLDRMASDLCAEGEVTRRVRCRFPDGRTEVIEDGRTPLCDGDDEAEDAGGWE